jgi:hypothetical protein
MFKSRKSTPRTTLVAACDWIAVLPGSMLASIGTGLFSPAMTGVALGSAPSAMNGLAAGVNDTTRQAGIAVAVAGLGALIPVHALYLHSASLVHGLRLALLGGAALAATGALAAWPLTRPREEGAADAAVAPAR